MSTPLARLTPDLSTTADSTSDSQTLQPLRRLRVPDRRNKLQLRSSPAQPSTAPYRTRVPVPAGLNEAKQGEACYVTLHARGTPQRRKSYSPGDRICLRQAGCKQVLLIYIHDPAQTSEGASSYG